VRVFILGLRRSGTTIFWQTLRQDTALTCFNEPFNPLLRELPEEIPNGSRAEMIDVFRRDPEHFWQVFAPIGRIEELQEGMCDRQRSYLRFLLDSSGSVCFDTTRCHFKVAALAEEAPDAVVVHLKRHPAAMASSHLIPSGSGGRRASWLVKRYGEVGFWRRHDRFNNWGVEDLVGRHPDGLFGQRLRESGLDPAAVHRLPAVGKLLAYWKICSDRVDRDGRRLYGDRFLSVRFEEFCRQPQQVVEAIYHRAGVRPPDIDVARIHPPRPPHAPSHPMWDRLFDELGISTLGWTA
jgi:hypothetical protein